MHHFNFLNTKYEKISPFCIAAEEAVTPADKAKECRKALGEIIEFIYDKCDVAMPKTATMLELIDGRIISEFVDNDILLNSLHFIRKVGMNAEHGNKITKKEARTAFDNLVFFTRFVVLKFSEPEKVKEFVLPKYFSEADTRKIYIDTYLREVGWEIEEPNTEKILPDGIKIPCGSVFPGKACCEIPVEGMKNKSGIGFCDYVLYGKDGKPLAIVEAKKTSTEASTGIAQVKEYGACIEKVCGYIPVLYYTNGYEIYVIDGTYPARKVMAFHTEEELKYMLQKRTRGDITDLNVRDDISGRPYQKMAITSICERFNEKHRRGLIVMATGTGKTRVSISLVELLMRNGWVKNVLFLADRTSLVNQAFDNFKNILENMTFGVLSDKSKKFDSNARIVFSTHQTMINYIDDEKKEFSSGRFDLIIIDEAHRSVFNKYGAIFKYFDALLVGLTATPKDEVDASTYQLFNCENSEPNFAYSLEEAVKDKYLVPFEVQSRTTRIMSQGIKYKDLTDKDKREVESIFEDSDSFTDETVLPKESVFKVIYNKDTCKRVLEDLMEHGLRVDYGQKIGKSIIFAYNHEHAKLIVETFNELYPSYASDNTFCQLVDNYVKGANDLIKSFDTNDNFRIAVSVDMLDTGVDVPAVLNLVFFKPVKSRIKFMQMIGRGTRLCKGLIDGKDKEKFFIFDYCSNFEFFDEHPDGTTYTNGKSLSQKLFDLRLDIMVELQKTEHQEVPLKKDYHAKLQAALFEKVKGIRSRPERISVREKISYLDKYCDFERWQALSVLEKKEIQLNISPLLNNDIEEDKGALAFDLKFLAIELAVLCDNSVMPVSKNVEVIMNTAKELLLKGSLKEVQEKAETLKILVDPVFWENVPSVDKLEKYREEVRQLVYLLKNELTKIFIDTDDDVLTGTYTGKGFIDIRTYKEKVIDYLAENSDNHVVMKIRNLEPITNSDLKELEKILWEELGTKEDYQNTTKIVNLAAFIRSIVGIEQEAVNEKFGEFLSGNIFNSRQQEFIKAIIDYVRVNGDIDTKDLIEKSPFDSYSIMELFGSNTVILRQIVDIIHSSIIAA